MLPLVFLACFRVASSVVVVASPSQVAEGQYGLTIDAGDIAAGYTVPGQYVQIRTSSDAKAGFFAIASPPDKRCVLDGVCVWVL